MAGCCIQQRYNFLVVAALVLLALPDQVYSAIENVSRGKNATMSGTYYNGTASRANDGNYDNSSLDLCATVTKNTSNYDPVLLYNVTWTVDLGDLYTIYSVTIYSSAVLPDSTFSKDLHVALRTNLGSTDYTYPYTIFVQPGGNYTVKIPTRRARYISVYRSPYDMALCEIDVMGSSILSTPEVEISLKKPTNQSSTYSGRLSQFAVDGDHDQTNLNKCATAYTPITYDEAWWQVDLGQLYVVNTVDMYFPTVGRDKNYMDAFNVYVSIDADRNYYTNIHLPLLAASNGTASVNYSRYSIVGRYVTIVKLSGFQYTSVLTVCEVVVRGVAQNVSADDKELNIFKVTPQPSTSNDPVTVTESTYRSLAIAAIVIASAFALFSLIMLVVCIVVVRGHCRMEKHDKAAAATKPNKYEESDLSKQPQRHEMPLPPTPGEDEYVEYDDISVPQQPKNGQKPRR